MRAIYLHSAYYYASLCVCAVVTNAYVRINEVADKGRPDTCSGSDWVELFNQHSQPVSLAGLVLHDDNGAADRRAFALSKLAADEQTMAAGAYLLLCAQGDGVASPAFKIGGDDTVSLTDAASGKVVSTTGKLADDNAAGDKTTGYFGGEYKYTYAATPGAANVFKEQADITSTTTDMPRATATATTKAVTSIGKYKHTHTLCATTNTN